MRMDAFSVAIALAFLLSPASAVADEADWVPETAAQSQLRSAATAAVDAGQFDQAAELMEGYLQLGATDLGYLELANLRTAQGRCDAAAAALDAASSAPRSAVITSDQVADRTRRVRGELALNCEGTVEPEVLYELGLEYFEGRAWTKAARAFVLAFDDDPNTILAYNAARSFEYAGDLDRAVEFYEKALGLDPDADLRDRLERTLERLSNLRARTVEGEEVGLLDVSSRPGGAIVRVDGIVVGQTPYQAAHPVGAYEITVESEGFSEYERDVELASGDEVVIDVTLSPSGRFWTWFSLAGTLATTAGGVGLGLLAQAALDDANDPVTRRDPDAFASATDRGRVLSGTSVALYAVSAVGAALTVWFYYAETPSAIDRGAVTVTVGPQWVGLQFDW